MRIPTNMPIKMHVVEKTALNKSQEWLRSELRRREQVADDLELATAAGDSVWSPRVPLLDEALMELREPDRLAVTLHFKYGFALKTENRLKTGLANR